MFQMRCIGVGGGGGRVLSRWVIQLGFVVGGYDDCLLRVRRDKDSLVYRRSGDWTVVLGRVDELYVAFRIIIIILEDEDVIAG